MSTDSRRFGGYLTRIATNICSNLRPHAVFCLTKPKWPKSSKIYDKVFQGRDIDYYWATSSCKGIGWFLTTSGSAFLKIIDGKFRTNKLMSLRRLFIYDSDDELQDYKTRLCFFLHQQSNYEYKIITRSDFESILNGFEDRTLVQDFGIYGEHFVWETVSDDRITIQHGYICVNDIRLKKYRQLYFKLWEAGIDYKVQDEKFKEILKNFKRIVSE